MPIKYPKKQCKNPICATGSFVPDRPNQLFCDEQCKNHFHNTEKKKARESIFKREKILKHNYKTLEKLKKESAYKKQVPEYILLHEKFDLTAFTDQSINEPSKRKINWSHGYGLELIAESPVNTYFIHSR
jgi:hypothetical protein